MIDIIRKALTNPQEIPLALSSRLKRIGWHRNYKKFIVLSRSRTGSNLLISILNSHSSIDAKGEVFERLHGKPMDSMFNSVFCKYPRHTKAVGFKIFYYHPMDDNGSRSPVWTKLREMPGLHVVHLMRRNILRTLISRKIAFATDVWEAKNEHELISTKEKKVNVAESELLREIEQTVQFQTDFADMFGSQRIVDIYYEDLVDNVNHQFARITKMFGLPFTVPKVTTKKQNPEKLAHLIVNYHSLKIAFADTEWSHLFED